MSVANQLECKPGYSTAAYADSLSEFGSPVALPSSGGYLLERAIPNSSFRDAMGCYPLFACEDWRALADDLNALRSRLVSAVVVSDPFGNYDEALLENCFDRVVRFKDHYLVDLETPLETIGVRHHRYYGRKSLDKLDVTVFQAPEAAFEAATWTNLYSVLVERHKLTGIKAFSPEAFRKQLQAPGAVLFVGYVSGEPVVGQIWYVSGDVAYSHLTAASDQGYKARAMYGIYWFAIDYFHNHLKWLDLGAGAGVNSAARDGLTQFKQGWSNATRPVYVCGKILDLSRYSELLASTRTENVSYFPAYRAGEF